MLARTALARRGSRRLLPQLPTFALRAGQVAAALAVGFVAAPAHADVSSWLFVGSGATHIWQGDQLKLRPNLLVEAGIGTPATHPWSVGMMYKFQPIFSHGLDLDLALRIASRSFTTGGWGVAMDFGGYQRFIRESRGLEGSLILGAPWGITLRATGGFGTEDQQHASVILGIDLARLTVHRISGQNWWKNSVPAESRMADDRGGKSPQ